MKTLLAVALMLVSPLALAAIGLSVDGLISAIIWLVIAGLIFWLCCWLLGQIGVPEPFNKIIRIFAALIAFLIVLNVLLGLAGSPIFVVR